MRTVTAIIACLLVTSPAFAKKPGKPKPRPRLEQTLLIVPDSLKDEANAACLEISPYARDTFSVSYEDDKGDLYWVCSWRMTANQLAQYESLMAKYFGKGGKGEEKRIEKGKAIHRKEKGVKVKPHDKLKQLKLSPKASKELKTGPRKKEVNR